MPQTIQPRVGISWQPEIDKAMVIRAAYGISNFTESTGTNNLLYQNPPFVIPHGRQLLRSHPAASRKHARSGFLRLPVLGLHRSLPQLRCRRYASQELPFTSSIPTIFVPLSRSSTTSPFSISSGNSSTFQLSYVGQKTDHLMTIALINQKVLQSNGTVTPSPYLNPTLQGEIGAARLTASNGYSNYNALQATFQKRLSHGLEFQGNYTWAKCMGNSSGFYAQYGDTNAQLTQAGNNHFFFQNTYNPGADYGRCDQNVTNSFNGFVTYDLPFGRGRTFGSNMNRVADLVAGGWQVNSILQFHTGFPITAQAADASGTGSGFARANCNGAPVETPYKRVAGGYESGYAVPLSTPGNIRQLSGRKLHRPWSARCGYERLQELRHL